MIDTDLVIALLIVFVVVAGFAFPAIIIETQYPANPAKWRSERRRRVERAQVKRISTLEHDLGYVPCSNDDCWECKRMVSLPNGGVHVISPTTDEIVRKVYDKSIKIPTEKILK